ncbi:hypothetical protein [Thioalkalivibrio sp. ALE19]|uniref:hypothetical protein n=1 Tax=Thioalkalivibrio sp. ALE19 TaxID=1266909 RepID=UPI000491629A|nr:hypothetical protein [Thioalkalivibrio sp. ALE19]
MYRIIQGTDCIECHTSQEAYQTLRSRFPGGNATVSFERPRGAYWRISVHVPSTPHDPIVHTSFFDSSPLNLEVDFHSISESHSF